MLNTDILEEENDQILYLQVDKETIIECRFMWWRDQDTIEVIPVGQIILLAVKRHHFNKLFHSLPE